MSILDNLLKFKNTIFTILILTGLAYGYSQYQFKEGIEVGINQQKAEQLQVDRTNQELKEDLRLLLVEELKNIQVINKNISNTAIKEVITKEIYKDCVIPVEAKRIIQEALEPRI